MTKKPDPDRRFRTDRPGKRECKRKIEKEYSVPGNSIVAAVVYPPLHTMAKYWRFCTDRPGKRECKRKLEKEYLYLGTVSPLL